MKWLERKPDWLKKDGSDDSSFKKEKSGDYGVLFIPLKCPKCKSKRIKCYSSRPPIRYHYCKDCGHNFKSIEKDY